MDGGIQVIVLFEILYNSRDRSDWGSYCLEDLFADADGQAITRKGMSIGGYCTTLRGYRTWFMTLYSIILELFAMITRNR